MSKGRKEESGKPSIFVRMLLTTCSWSCWETTSPTLDSSTWTVMTDVSHYWALDWTCTPPPPLCWCCLGPLLCVGCFHLIDWCRLNPHDTYSAKVLLTEPYWVESLCANSGQLKVANGCSRERVWVHLMEENLHFKRCCSLMLHIIM